MNQRFFKHLRLAIPAIVLSSVASGAVATTLNQNVSWTVDRAGTATKYRAVAYGDSIFAGYNTSLFNVAKYAGTTVQAEYLSALWNTDIENVRRTKSGAVAKDIYDNKIVAERAYMQASNTRVVAFEMCGNDGLQARSDFMNQTGTCSNAKLDAAVANCATYVPKAMDFINANAYAGTKVKLVATLHYPGYNTDNKQSKCTDASTGTTVNVQAKMLPLIAKMNYMMCNTARQKGFTCIDTFAEFMGADYDSNADGKIDSEALRYVSGESEASYVNRITTTLRSTVRDANAHFVNASTSYDYLLSDDTHMTYTGGTVGSNSSGSGAARYPSYTGGKSPVWNQFGHERLGWSLSTANPSQP